MDLASQGKEPEPEPVPKILVFTQDLKYIPASVQYRKELEEKGIMAETVSLTHRRKLWNTPEKEESSVSIW